MQNAAANIGAIIIPMLVGLVCGRIGFEWFPCFLLALLLCSIALKAALDIRRRRYPPVVIDGDA